METASAGFHPAFVLLLAGALLSLWAWRRWSLQRGLQVLTLALFVALLWLAGPGGRPRWPVDLFLFTDPLVAAVHTLAGRNLVGLLAVSLVFVALAALMGRVFCSHVCPLGTLFDLCDRGLAARPGSGEENRTRYRRARRAKYVALLVLLGAATTGFNLLGFADPMVIATRSASTVFYPAIMALADLGVALLRVVGGWLDWLDLAYLEGPHRPSFEGALVMAALLALLVLLGRLQARFWCRHLCPLGGLLAWVGRRAPYRRQVGEGCTSCGACARGCPAGAIHEGGDGTDRSECLVCRRCAQVCPEQAVRFAFAREGASADTAGPDLSRRAFVSSTASGLAVGAVLATGLLHPTRSRSRRSRDLIRPPGALPEPEFLSRCVRCGECLRACPTSALQLDWHRVGIEGLWAPRLDLRGAACDQDCNLCGQVCPTRSIRPLELDERRHARVGTAILLRDACLAWARDERCTVCHEQCPWGAVVFERDEQHRVDLPVVQADRCNGCGWCEDLCPVLGEAAIVVTPHGEIRLSEGSYVQACRDRGVIIEPARPPDPVFRVDDSRLPGQPEDP